MLTDFSEMGDRAIARHVGVAHTFVSAVRNPAVAQKQQVARVESAAKKSPAKVESDSTTSDFGGRRKGFVCR